MCLYPKLIKNPRYKATKKNRGIVPICNDERKKIIPIGCGKCMVCMKQRAREWKYRIIEDLKVHKNAKYLHRYGICNILQRERGWKIINIRV